jgi:hypothetical protein
MAGTTSWNVTGASVQGASHVKRGIVCQDAHGWRTETSADGRRWLFAAVADGAGSAGRSDEGAQTAVDVALEALTRDLSHEAFDKNAEPPDSALQTLLRLGMEEAISAIDELAESEENAQPSDFAATLLLLVAGPSRAAAAQVGDGAVLYETSEGEYTLMTTPQNGEYANQTIFITSSKASSAIEVSHVDSTASRFALFTDGIEQVALDTSEMEPHGPFFDPFFQFVAQQDISQESMRDRLETFLKSSRLQRFTDDDLTLLLASQAKAPASEEPASENAT